MKIRIGGFSCHINCYVTQLASPYDLILGNSFLTECRAVLDFHTKTCSVSRDGKQYILTPAACADNISAVTESVSSASLATIPVEKCILNTAQARKSVKQGCQYFVVAVNAVKTVSANEASSAATPSALAAEIATIKQEFKDIFADPSGLPPDRGISHVILWYLMHSLHSGACTDCHLLSLLK